MKNNESPKSGAIRTFFQEKGYYIALALCICAVGISGYVFVSNAISEKNKLSEQTLSIATGAVVPEQERPVNAPQPQPQAQTEAQPRQEQTQSAEEPAQTRVSSVRVWPVAGPTQMPYSVDALCYNATMRDWRTHEGIDLESPLGTRVKAACAGTVSAVYDDEYLGSCVEITHADGYVTRYCNLAAMPTVSAGDAVDAGDIIGAVGDTALLETGEEPHLHFAVYHNRVAVDPAEFID